MPDYVVSNINWIFSGAGTFLLGILFSIYTKRKREKLQKRKIESDIRPIMSFLHCKVWKEENGTYPIYIYFKNTGKGIARIYVIDTDTGLQTHIGEHITVGVNDQAYVKVWLHETEKQEEFRFSLYYWDIEEHCYRTEGHLQLKHYDAKLNPHGQNNLYFVKCINFSRIEKKDNCLPKEVIQWPKGGRSLYYYKWW